MIALALAALLSASPVQDVPAAQATPAKEDATVRLEDVEVTGRSLESMIDNFVGSVAAPNPNRSLAAVAGRNMRQRRQFRTRNRSVSGGSGLHRGR